MVFVVLMKRIKPNKILGRKTIKWWKCIDGVAIEYRERMKVKYEELGEEVGDVEEEWKKYKDAFVGNADEPCGRSTGMGEKARTIIRNGGQPKSHQQYVKRRKPGSQCDGEMLHLYGQKKKAAKKSVDKTRNDMEADLYTKLV